MHSTYLILVKVSSASFLLFWGSWLTVCREHCHDCHEMLKIWWLGWVKILDTTVSCQKMRINQILSVSQGCINVFQLAGGKMCKLVDSTLSLHFTSFHLDFYILSLFMKCCHAQRTVSLRISACLKILKFYVLFWSDTHQASFYCYWNGSSNFQLWSEFPNLFSIFVWSNLTPWKLDGQHTNCSEKSTNQCKPTKMLQRFSAVILWGIFASHMP